MGIEEGKLEEELVDKPENHDWYEVFRITLYPNPVFNEMWFLTIDPFVGIPVFIAKLSERQYCRRVIEDFHSQEYIQFSDKTVASSCVCSSPLAVMTIVGLHDFVKVSISALLKSFLLITCIDESTTNSLSSGLLADGAGSHQFSESEKNAVSCFSFNFRICFWPTSTLLRGHIALAIPSLPETDPQILEHWGCVDEDHLGKYIRHTLDWLPHVCALPENRLRRRHVLNCRASDD